MPSLLSKFIFVFTLAWLVGLQFAFAFPLQSPKRWLMTTSLTSTSSSASKSNEFIQAAQQIKAKLQPKVQAVPQLAAMTEKFIDEYAESNMLSQASTEQFQANILRFFQEVLNAMKSPFPFSPYHQAIRSPFDYYTWGNDFLRPMIISEQSKLEGREHIAQIEEYLAKGDNVILFSNHQTEADPQVMSILLESIGKGHLAEKIIFVAGHKVTSDPVAIPFSMGRNLICIHSKKHIKSPPEDYPKKQAQNLESMKALAELIEKGGAILWIAPSGGRDRPREDQDNRFEVAAFDPKSIDMFRLLSMKSAKSTHFFPMAMFTHQLVPPPKTVSSGVGEERSGKRGAVSLSFLAETQGLGALGDRKFTEEMHQRVVEAYEDLALWHLQTLSSSS